MRHDNSVPTRHALTFSQRLVVANWITDNSENGVLKFTDSDAAIRCRKDTNISVNKNHIFSTRRVMKITAKRPSGKSGPAGTIYTRVTAIERYLDSLDANWRPKPDEPNGL